MEDQVNRLVKKTWARFLSTAPNARLMIAVSGIPGSGKTTLATIMAGQLNKLYGQEHPGLAPIATVVPMDGYHLTRAQLAAMPDPMYAIARRGAAFTFDPDGFLILVRVLREPLAPETGTVYAPSFDHAVKDPVENDIPIPATSRVVFFEGNYLSLNKEPWSTAARLMDGLWFVDVDFDTARKRLIHRHVRAGIAKDETEAEKRVTENDLVNGREIVDHRMDVQEIIVSKTDQAWEQD